MGTGVNVNGLFLAFALAASGCRSNQPVTSHCGGACPPLEVAIQSALASATQKWRARGFCHATSVGTCAQGRRVLSIGADQGWVLQHYEPGGGLLYVQVVDDKGTEFGSRLECTDRVLTRDLCAEAAASLGIAGVTVEVGGGLPWSIDGRPVGGPRGNLPPGAHSISLDGHELAVVVDRELGEDAAKVTLVKTPPEVRVPTRMDTGNVLLATEELPRKFEVELPGRSELVVIELSIRGLVPTDPLPIVCGTKPGPR
ncbi:MAG: hypothetical protein H6Q89_211 [Myxococcaceae bacterium]|nr:hypothetical protein [Myxococcaceae bacterium]